jgi:glutamate N-acetyltransferase/amino-acid N-acetyltransferase
LDKIKKALPELVLSLSNKNFVKASKAIMTTDTFNKICSDSIKSGKKHARILGIAKGAGMIAPNLATMISVIITDVKAPKPILEKALKESVGSSFNCVTVDGDMSTNDTVILLANGASGIDIGSSKSVYKKFAGALNSTCLTLAKMIARDGEGATKFIEINVKGAKTNAQARAVAMKVANSCLFKTMCYGEDPNFGRVAACCGAASKDIRPQAIDIYLNGIAAVKSGVAISKKINKNIFKGDEIKVAVNLNIGNKSAKVFTCDLSPEYVKINAAYS